MSHSQSRPSPARARLPSASPCVGLLGILLLLSQSSLLSESRSKEVFISGGAIDPSPRFAQGKKRGEARRLNCARRMGSNRGKEGEKEWEGGGRRKRHHAMQSVFSPSLSSPALVLLPFPFLTVGRSIGSRKRCTRNWPRPQTATYRASCPLPPSLRVHCTCEKPFLPKRASEARTIIQTKL